MSEADRRLPFRVFAPAALGILACVGGAVLGIDRAARPELYAVLMVAASFLWCFLAWQLLRKGRIIPLSWVVGAGLVLRAVLLLGEPAQLSDDLYRYVWEGRVQWHADAARRNPFLTPPADYAAEADGDPIWEGINHKEVPAAYPPACQLYLALLARTGAGLVGFRNGFAFLDLLLLLLIPHWLSRIGRPPGLALIHALCPLVLVELVVEGHNDVLGLLLLVASFAVLGRDKELSKGRVALGGALYGVAIAAKFLPVLVVPWLWRRDKRILLPAALALLACYVPFLPEPARWPELFAGLGRFGHKWAHNDTVFGLVRAGVEAGQQALASSGHHGWLADLAHTDALARVVVGLRYLGGYLWIFWLERYSAAALVPCSGSCSDWPRSCTLAFGSVVRPSSRSACRRPCSRSWPACSAATSRCCAGTAARLGGPGLLAGVVVLEARGWPVLWPVLRSAARPCALPRRPGARGLVERCSRHARVRPRRPWMPLLDPTQAENGA
ncbi:MAG: hypothetical protein R3F30_09055 [Planctomycetota bacterium]